MNVYTATELAYKNGYKKGVEDCTVKESQETLSTENTQKQFIDRAGVVSELDDLIKAYLEDGSVQCHIAAGTTISIRDDIILARKPASVTEVPIGGMGELSDGFHTFNELYHHRAILFSVICNSMPNKAWKSKLHSTGDMFPGMFIVGISTPEGYATYHFDIEPYWDMFNVQELTTAPEWDGHTPEDAINRISKLRISGSAGLEGEWKLVKKALFGNDYVCPFCGEHAPESNCGHYDNLTNYCSKCGAKLKVAAYEN
jgi:hypothetical protein